MWNMWKKYKLLSLNLMVAANVAANTQKLVDLNLFFPFSFTFSPVN